MKKSHIKSTKKAFRAIVKEGELLMSLSSNFAEAEDDDGNKIKVFFWLNGDWKVDYKGREFIIPLNENIGALIDWINAGEPES